MRCLGRRSLTAGEASGPSANRCRQTACGTHEAMLEVLSQLQRHPPMCSAPGAAVERSRVLQGIVLHHHPSSPLMLPLLERCVQGSRRSPSPPGSGLKEVTFPTRFYA